MPKSEDLILERLGKLEGEVEKLKAVESKQKISFQLNGRAFYKTTQALASS